MFKVFKGKKTESKVLSPVTGTAIPISEIADPVFSEKALGDGVAILPTSSTVVAPISGTIAQVAHTLHAFCIEGEDGLQVLTHLGLDTVKLDGEGFTCHVKVGDKVQQGDKVMEMDLSFIKSKGLDTASPVIVLNMEDFEGFTFSTGEVTAGVTSVIEYKK